MEYFATVADKRFILDWDKLPDNSKERIIRYGVQRIINDRCGGTGKTKDEKHEIAQAMLDALKSGEFATRGSGGVDPVLVEARRLALKAWIAKDEAKRKDVVKEMDKDARDAHADKILAAVPDAVRVKLMEMGKVEVDRKLAEREAKRKAADSVADAMGNIDL